MVLIFALQHINCTKINSLINDILNDQSWPEVLSISVIKLKNLFANLQYWRKIFHFAAKSFLRLNKSSRKILNKLDFPKINLLSHENIICKIYT